MADGTGTHCDICMQEIDIDENGREYCGCRQECPCGCGDDPTRCVYAAHSIKQQPLLLPCGHPIGSQELMLEDGKFYCTICGANISAMLDGPADETDEEL